MKKIAYYLATVVATGSLVGCSDTVNENTGIGRLLLNTEISPELKLSRAIADQEAQKLADECLIWISNEKGLVREYKGISNVPADGIWLTGGRYVAEAWAGDSVPASFTQRFFKGCQPFEIASGNVDRVNLVCKIANVGVDVEYEPDIRKVLEDVKLTVESSAGSLTWAGLDPEQGRGYFMINSRDLDKETGTNNFKYTISGTTQLGENYIQQGVLKNVKPGIEYLLKISHDGVNKEEGGLFFTIEIDETTIDTEHNIEVISAPVITNRYGYLDVPERVEPGKIPDQRIGVVATADLVSVVVSVPGMEAYVGLDGTDSFDILYIHEKGDEETHNMLEARGIEHQFESREDSGDDMLIIFRSELLNRLPEGTYPITVTATDTNGKVGSGTLVLVVTDATVGVEPLDESFSTVWAYTATLSGSVVKETESAGFNYREQGTELWTYIEGIPSSRAWAKGAKYYVTLNGLKPGTTYEYCAAADGYISDEIYTFTTEAAAQLPNSGFEQWNTSSTPYLIYSNGTAMFWDSGNHGSATMSKNVTVPDENIKHSGNYSIKLASQFVGIGALGKFAAGNVFIGEYLETKGTNGVLGWGRSWNTRPKQLKGYVRYEPVAITHEKTDQGYKKGDMDTGIIYIALLDGSKKQGNSSYPAYPVVVDTSVPTLFNENSDDVIAYGKVEFNETTPGTGMVEFTITLDYRRTDIKPSYIMCTASASKGGDYFAGGNGSVMYLDDLELVY